MEICETASRTVVSEPWLGTAPEFSSNLAHFAMSDEGLQWHPRELAGWSRHDLFLLVEVLNQYARHRSY